MNGDALISAKPYLKVIKSLCITQSNEVARIYLRIHSKTPQEILPIILWFKKGKVPVYAIGPVYDRASNKKTNQFFVLIKASRATNAISWGTEKGTKFNSCKITIERASDSRDLKKAANKNKGSYKNIPTHK